MAELRSPEYWARLAAEIKEAAAAAAAAAAPAAATSFADPMETELLTIQRGSWVPFWVLAPKPESRIEPEPK